MNKESYINKTNNRSRVSGHTPTHFGQKIDRTQTYFKNIRIFSIDRLWICDCVMHFKFILQAWIYLDLQ